MPQGNSTTKEYCKALIKKQQMDISEELSISTYQPGQNSMVFRYTRQDMETSHDS